MKTKIDPAIFRDYDIRGIYPSQINEDTYYTLGKSLAFYFKENTIAVGQDTRLSSPSLTKALINGINSGGVDVVDLGMISTDMHNFASGKYGYPVNVIVTASHNPPQYNGLKIVKKGVEPIFAQNGMPEIKTIALTADFPVGQKKGAVTKFDIFTKWINYIESIVDISKLRKLKVVIDAGNGMGGLSWNAIIRKTNLEIIPLFFAPDGNFPHHLPDPLKEDNLKQLKNKILSEQADLGFAIDGDADRLFVLDDQSRVLSGTITGAILAEYLLKKNGGGNVLYNVVIGKIVPEIIKQNDGFAVKVRVGHSYIKQAMKKHDGLFACEHSGHFYFRDLFYSDSSFLAGLYFLQAIGSQPLPLSSLIKKYDKYNASGEINYKTDKSAEIFTLLKNNFPAGTFDETDGLTVRFAQWWCNLRSSKTEPLLRLNLEADSQDILKEKLRTIESILEAQGAHKVA